MSFDPPVLYSRGSVRSLRAAESQGDGVTAKICSSHRTGRAGVVLGYRVRWRKGEKDGKCRYCYQDSNGEKNSSSQRLHLLSTRHVPLECKVRFPILTILSHNRDLHNLRRREQKETRLSYVCAPVCQFFGNTAGRRTDLPRIPTLSYGYSLLDFGGDEGWRRSGSRSSQTISPHT